MKGQSTLLEALLIVMDLSILNFRYVKPLRISWKVFVSNIILYKRALYCLDHTLYVIEGLETQRIGNFIGSAYQDLIANIFLELFSFDVALKLYLTLSLFIGGSLSAIKEIVIYRI